MRLLVQRVTEAKVVVADEVVGQIGKGILVLFGVHQKDSEDHIPWLAKKLATLRMFPDEEKKMNRSVEDVNGEILIVSQFTLYANCLTGRRPSFTDALNGSEAKKLYDRFVLEVKKYFPDVQTGVFGAKMAVQLVNDGPVTFLIDRD